MKQLKKINYLRGVKDEKERNKKLEEYSNLIAEIGEEKPNKEKTLNYVLSGISFIPAVGEGASIINLLLQVIKDFKLKDKWMLNRIEADKASKEEEVYLLDKLSRVARIEQLYLMMFDKVLFTT